MNNDPQPDSMPDWRDPFSEPNTFPGGWDLSGLTPPDQPGAADAAKPPAASDQPFYALVLYLN